MVDETEDLHMFYIADSDYVVATSIDDAWTVWEEQTGSKRTDEEDYECELVADDRVIGCQVDASGEPCEVGGPGSRTEEIKAVEWARKLGRGFAFSENY